MLLLVWLMHNAELPFRTVMQLGDRVTLDGGQRAGTLRWLGPVEFQEGTWAGIELDAPTGKNDGTVKG